MASFAVALCYFSFFWKATSVDDGVGMLQSKSMMEFLPTDVCAADDDFVDKYQDDILPAERLSFCNEINCNWQQASAEQPGPLRDVTDLNTLITFMTAPTPVRGSIQADLIYYKCMIHEKFRYEMGWFNDGDDPPDTIASVSAGTDGSVYNRDERLRTMGAFYAVFLFTRLAATTDKDVHADVLKAFGIKSFPVEKITAIMKSVYEEEKGVPRRYEAWRQCKNNGLRDLLLLTAVHDMFKARRADDTKEGRWLPADRVEPGDHDSQLAEVLSDKTKNQGMSQHKFGETGMLVASQQLAINFGWLVQFEGPPNIVLDNFVEVMKQFKPAAKTKILNFYLSHYFTDLAGAQQKKDKPPVYFLHFLVDGWANAGIKVVQLLGEEKSAPQIYEDLLVFLANCPECTGIGQRRLVVWAAQLKLPLHELLKTLENPVFAPLMRHLEISGYDTAQKGSKMTTGNIGFVKYGPQTFRKILEMGPEYYEMGVNYLMKGFEYATEQSSHEGVWTRDYSWHDMSKPPYTDPDPATDGGLGKTVEEFEGRALGDGFPKKGALL
jgi:hypothetical protein